MSTESALKVLVVEDDATVLLYLETILQSAGFSVETFTRPRDALARAQGEFFHVVVADFQMPEMNGADLLREIARSHPATSGIILTAAPDSVTVQDRRNAGAVCVLMKPFPQQSLLDLVGRLGRLSALHQASRRERPLQPNR